MSTFNPDRWLSSLIDSMEAELRSQMDSYLDTDSTAVFQIAWTHFASERETSESELIDDMNKTLIHFNIDDITNMALGFGPGSVQADFTEPTVSDPGSFIDKKGRRHDVNLDVGVVATDAAGGSSARLTAYEMLDSIFGSFDRRTSFRANTDGIEIVSFTSGRFAKDSINDVRVFRVIGGELVVRVYSRDVASDPVILVDDITQDPDLEIDGSPIVDDD